jgi:hypothetical protein
VLNQISTSLQYERGLEGCRRAPFRPFVTKAADSSVPFPGVQFFPSACFEDKTSRSRVRAELIGLPNECERPPMAGDRIISWTAGADHFGLRAHSGHQCSRMRVRSMRVEGKLQNTMAHLTIPPAPHSRTPPACCRFSFSPDGAHRRRIPSSVPGRRTRAG